MEDLNQFRARTGFVWDSLPRAGSFATSPKLREKVGEDGQLRPFFGDTVIYGLTPAERSGIAAFERALRCACPELLAEPLPEDSLHLTLHDLNSAPQPEPIAAQMERARAACRELMAELPEELRRPIALRSTAAFSMVATSTVLGFEPASEEDCEALMALYKRFQGVVRLNYPLTPHVTLAYYRPGDHGEAGLQALRRAFEEINRTLPPVELHLTEPVYARFTDMKRYLPDG